MLAERPPPKGYIGEIRLEDRRRRPTRSSTPSARWPQGGPKDFERDCRRKFTERATGIVYDLCHGNPLLG